MLCTVTKYGGHNKKSLTNKVTYLMEKLSISTVLYMC